MRPVLLIGAVAAILVGCTGPTELSNADVEAQRKQFSQENYENSMKKAGKSGEVDQMKQSEAERAGERSH